MRYPMTNVVVGIVMLTVVHASAGDFFNVTDTGNVGIGTTSPAYLLDVSGSGTGLLDVLRVRNAVTAANNSAAEFLFSANRTTGGLTNIAGVAGMITDTTNTAYKGALVFSTANNAAPAERMRIDHGGNVGIGTTSPGEKLEIAGKLRFNPESVDELLLYNDGTNKISIGVGSGELRVGAVNAASQKITFGGWTQGSPNTFTEYMRIDTSNGNVGIGTTSPGNILTVVQNSTTDPIADAWTTYSSIRWKEHIAPLTGALNKIEQLRTVYFDWKQNKQRDLGMIAEEVGVVLPEVVAYEPNGKDAKSIDYGRLTAVLVQAIKEQQAQIRELRQEIAALKHGQ